MSGAFPGPLLAIFLFCVLGGASFALATGLSLPRRGHDYAVVAQGAGPGPVMLVVATKAIVTFVGVPAYGALQGARHPRAVPFTAEDDVARRPGAW